MDNYEMNFDVDEERSHAAAGVNAVGSSGAQGGCCDVRSVALPVVGVYGSIGVGGGRGGVKPCDPFLIVVTAGVAVGFVINVVEVVEGTVFVVNARVEHGDDDAFAVVTATNYALGYQDFTAEIVSKDGAAYDGIEVFPAEGAFGPKNSVPSKEKIPNTDRLMRPYGATVPFKLAWKKTAPQLNIQSTGAPLGPQRVWSNSSTANFPDDAYLLVKSEEEDMAWKVDFTA